VYCIENLRYGKISGARARFGKQLKYNVNIGPELGVLSENCWNREPIGEFVLAVLGGIMPGMEYQVHQQTSRDMIVNEPKLRRTGILSNG
jgi:hypothetical protein